MPLEGFIHTMVHDTDSGSFDACAAVGAELLSAMKDGGQATQHARQTVPSTACVVLGAA